VQDVRELRKNKVPVRKAVFINSAKLNWYTIKPQVPKYQSTTEMLVLLHKYAIKAPHLAPNDKD